MRQQFASDNIAGMCPEVVEAFEKANGTGHEVAYGEDSWTQMVCDRIRDLFQTDCEVFFVFNGTAANSLAPVGVVPFLSFGHRPRTGPCRNRRMRRSGVLFQWLEDPFGQGRERKADPRCRRGIGDQAQRHPLSQAQGRVADPGDRGPAPSIRSRSCVPLPRSPSAEACASIWTGRVSPMRWRRWVCIRPRSLGGRGSMSCASAAPRTACRSATRWFSSRPRWPRISPIGLSRRGSWRRRCVSFPHPGSACWKRTSGCATPGTPTPWRGGCMTPSSNSTGWRPCSHAKPTPCSSNCRLTPRQGLVDRGWKFYTFIGSGGCRFMCSWDTTTESVDRLAADIRELVAA